MDPPVGLARVDIRVKLISSEGHLLVEHISQVELGGGSVPVGFSKEGSSKLIQGELDGGVSWLEVPAIGVQAVSDVLQTQVEMVAIDWEHLVLH